MQCISASLPRFRHLDFTDIPGCLSLVRCNVCGGYANGTPEVAAECLAEFLPGEKYAASGQTEQSIYSKTHGDAINRCELQSDHMLQHLRLPTFPRILDIGCFDGRLLSALRKRLPNAELYGLDVNKQALQQIENRFNIDFHAGHLHSFSAARDFDVIVLSHSAIYLPKLKESFDAIHSLLSPQGAVYLQVADLDRNPCNLLLGDQFRYFSSLGLSSALELTGFKVTHSHPEAFPADAVTIAYKSDKNVRARECHPKEADKKTAPHERLIDMARWLKEIGFEDCLTLGTTVNAAFADSILGTRNQGFVDENMRQGQGVFRNKPIKHPSELSKDATVLIPYFERSKHIAYRFRNTYFGRFLHPGCDQV